MGTYATAYAIVCAAAVAAAIWTGTVLSFLGIGLYAYFDRIFGAKLQRGRADAYKDGYERGRIDGERLKKYTESPYPKTAMEVQETKTWAEGLAALYPNDPQLKAELDLLKKERNMLDSAG